MATHSLPTKSRNLPVGTVAITRRLYDAIEEHHINCLQMLFLAHYQSYPDGNHDRLWLTRLRPHVKHQIRLHLCVVRRHDLFDWTDIEVGTHILHSYNVI